VAVGLIGQMPTLEHSYTALYRTLDGLLGRG
jgi:hypothetical protein